MYAMKILPVFKDYLWGGDRLNERFGFDSGLSVTAEAWILSCHKDGESVVANGAFKGKTLSEVLKANPEFLGGDLSELPVLIKFIDAKDNLSLQVHPDEEYAVKYENDHGKTEAWYILDCEENSQLILGFEATISREEMREAIENNTILSKVNNINVNKGDIYFIPAGTIHAIGKGNLILEVQQNSNATYRVYDYGRLQNGKPRELHIEKSLDVTNTQKLQKPVQSPETVEFNGYTKTKLVDCDIFSLERFDINEKAVLSSDETGFVSVICVDGNGILSLGDAEEKIKAGDSFFIPAKMGEFLLNGNLSVLITKKS